MYFGPADLSCRQLNFQKMNMCYIISWMFTVTVYLFQAVEISLRYPDVAIKLVTGDRDLHCLTQIIPDFEQPPNPHKKQKEDFQKYLTTPKP